MSSSPNTKPSRRNSFQSPDPQGLNVPLSMIDVFALTTLWLVIALMNSEYLIHRHDLPALPEAQEGKKTPADRQPGIQIALKADGQVYYQEERVALEEVTQRVLAEATSDQPILISVEIVDEQSGPLPGFLQLQTDFLRAGIVERVKVLCRNKSTEATVTQSESDPVREDNS